MPRAPAAVGQHQAQRGFLRGQLGRIQVGRRAQAIDLQHERRRYRLGGGKALHDQIVGGERRLDGDLAGLLPEQCAQDGLRHGGRQG